MKNLKKIILSVLLCSISIFTNIACQNQADNAMENYWELHSDTFQQYIEGDPISAAEAILRSIDLDKSILKTRNKKAYQYGMALSYMRLYCLQKYTDFESTVNLKEHFLKFYQMWLGEEYNETLATEYIEEFKCAVYAIDLDNDVRWWATLDESASSLIQEHCLETLDGD